MDSTCLKPELLQCHVEGTLPEASRRSVNAHLSGCPQCRRAAAEYKQVMWDLSHPPDVTLPPELDRMYDTLMETWKQEHRPGASLQTASRSLVPAWVGYTFYWTRKLPGKSTLSSFVTRAAIPGIRLLLPLRPIRMRKRGGRH